MAFKTYRSVGSNVPITPMALCSAILLDGPIGQMNKPWIFKRAKEIINYCRSLKIPLVSSLQDMSWKVEIEKCLNFLHREKLIGVTEFAFIESESYYVLKKKRVELAYFKNTILHHFLTPFLIYLAWVRVKVEQLRSVEELESLILERRKDLKYEFYIPSKRKPNAASCHGRKFFSTKGNNLSQTVSRAK